MEVKDVLERCTGVRREPKARDARIASDAGGGENELTSQVDVRELRNGADVAARDDEHVKWGRAWFSVEGDEIIVLETNGRRCFVGCDPAEDALGG